jgi:hypothetical protein
MADSTSFPSCLQIAELAAKAFDQLVLVIEAGHVVKANAFVFD